jgi:ribosome biogenesis protein BRX1
MAAVYKTLKKRQKRMEEGDDADMGGDSDSSSSSSASEEPAPQTDSTTAPPNGAPANGTALPPRYKSRVLMLTSRGVSHRHRHLLSDLHSLLPHTILETKLDTSKKTTALNPALNSLAALHSTPTIFFLEARKRGQDLYLWLARSPNGPTAKCHVSNLHTSAELGFKGNVLKGGRGIVMFDKSFDVEFAAGGGGKEGMWRGVVRELLRGVFSVPKRGKGVKPFVDRVIGVFYVDEKIWVRVYEIREAEGGKRKVANAEDIPALPEGREKKSTSKEHDISLVEVGPRFVLTPILILEGSFGGPVIYENKEYVSPNQVRREVRMRKAGRYKERVEGRSEREGRRKDMGLEVGGGRVDELDSGLLFR